MKNKLLTWREIILHKLTPPQLVKKFPTFYKNQRFITVFTLAQHLSQLQDTLIQSMPLHPISLRSISILSSYLFLGVLSGLPPTDFSTKTPQCISFLPRMCYTLHSYHPHWDTWWAIHAIKLPNMSFSPVSCPSFLLAPDIFLTIQFFNNVNLCSSLNDWLIDWFAFGFRASLPRCT